jgi:MobA/MobL family
LNKPAGDPIYRLSADIVRRSEGRTVTAAAAYRAGEAILDQRTGLIFDYRRRYGVLDAGILAPENAPPWIFDRAELWNRVEAAEKRKDAQLARDIELALPHELGPAARHDLVHGFVRAAFVDAGMIADVALHALDARRQLDEARRAFRARKTDARRKIVVGAVVLAQAGRDPAFRAMLQLVLAAACHTLDRSRVANRFARRLTHHPCLPQRHHERRAVAASGR